MSESMFAQLRCVSLAVVVVGVGACTASDTWPPLALPAGGGSSASVPSLGPSKPMRVARLIDGPADAYMMAVAYQGAREVGRWGGPIDWFRVTPAAFTVERQGRSWQWSREDVKSLRVRAPNRERGGERVPQWATRLNADRVSIIVVDHPGPPDDGAGTEGLGVRGQGRGGERTKIAHTASVRGFDTEGEDAVEIGEGEPATGRGEKTSRPGDSAGTGTGEGDGVGHGSRATGTRDGSKHGSRHPSWYHNARSNIAERGGRTPADHGEKHGSASGEAGASGHANGAGWLNWLDVPVKLSGAAAVVAIALSADISGMADRLFQKVVRGMLRTELNRELVDTAKNLAKRRLKDGERAVRSNADEMSAAELAYAIDHLPAALERAAYANMQAHARKQASVYRTIANKTANRQDEVSQHANQLATENVRAWRHIEEVAGARGRAMKAAARPPDAVARQPYDPHRHRAALEKGHPGEVDSTTVPKANHPNVKYRGGHAPGNNIPLDIRGLPIFDHVAHYDLRVPRSTWYGRSRKAPQRAATRALRDALRSGRVSSKQFTKAQLRAIDKGYAQIPGLTWHHHQNVGRMQLISRKYHKMSQHVGGYELWQKTK